MELPFAVKVLSKLLDLGLAGVEAWTNEGFDTKELATLPVLTDLIGELGGKPAEGSSDMEALHLAVITRCFGLAFRRHWAFNESLAPRVGGFWPIKGKEERKRAEEIERRMDLALEALKELSKPGDRPVAQEWSQVTSLAGSPLSTPYYQALWSAFTNPKLDDESVGESPLLEPSGAGRLEFERHFLLAYHQALSTSVGQPLQSYLPRLRSDYRTRLFRELLLKEMEGWDKRHIFGNTERREHADDDPVPFLPLGRMYVEPDASMSEDPRGSRTPVTRLIERLFRESKRNVLIVKADFGMGKSLTARTLAQRWAHQFLTKSARSPELPLPIYIRCAEDLSDEGFNLDETVRSAWKRQADELGLHLKASDEALSLPGPEQRAVFLLDGLDEVILGDRRLESFFKRLRGEATEHHRFIIFSRPGALPDDVELRGIPVIELLSWQKEQREKWLACWRELQGGVGPTHSELESRRLAEFAGTPILLFMVAQTWSQHSTQGGTSRAALYEEFFWQIARGKHDVAREQHRNVAEASSVLREHLVLKGLLPGEAEALDAMLWLMGRVAWEATKLDQRQLLEPHRKPEMLTKRGIENLIADELGVGQNASDIINAIQMGLLLTMQAHLRSGTASQLLFGHKSFREYLVARYWADRLRALARARQWEWDGLEKPLLGGRLLSREDRTFEFLMEMLNGEPLPRRPNAPFALSRREHEALLEWAQNRFESEAQEDPSGNRHPTLRDDRRPWLREAALAIGSSLRDSPGMRSRDKLTVRTLLSWFWLMRIGPIIVAPKARWRDSQLSELSLRGANFRHADLQGVRFTSANLSRRSTGNNAPCDFTEARLDDAVLAGAFLEAAVFKKASLRLADLTHAILDLAELSEADLEGAQLIAARLPHARLNGSNLNGAKLIQADLRNASLASATLVGSYLHSANLEGAVLAGAILTGARYDKDTHWPVGFDPQAAGAILEDYTQ
jgi:uncharacterized protein YjbI with pentapeptide repeats